MAAAPSADEVSSRKRSRSIVINNNNRVQNEPVKRRGISTSWRRVQQEDESVIVANECIADSERLGMAGLSDYSSFDPDFGGFLDVNINIYDTAYFFMPFYGIDQREAHKNFSSFYSCDDPEIINSTHSVERCDYTDLLQLLRAPCEINSGQLYSVSINQTCPTALSGGDAGGFFQAPETNLPICIGRTCDNAIIQSLVQYTAKNSVSPDCFDTEYNYQAVVPSISGEECLKEMKKLVGTGYSHGIGSPDYVFFQEGYEDSYCDINNTAATSNRSCNFAATHSQLQSHCEAAGGYLYEFSDVYTKTYTNTTSAGTDVVFVETFYSYRVPVCLGSSCDARQYFDELLIPYYEFNFQGEFYENETTSSFGTYGMVNYQAVSNISVEESTSSNGGSSSRSFFSIISANTASVLFATVLFCFCFAG